MVGALASPAPFARNAGSIASSGARDCGPCLKDASKLPRLRFFSSLSKRVGQDVPSRPEEGRNIMRVREIMRTHVEIIGPRESPEAAVERMRRGANPPSRGPGRGEDRRHGVGPGYCSGLSAPAPDRRRRHELSRLDLFSRHDSSTGRESLAGSNDRPPPCHGGRENCRNRHHHGPARADRRRRRTARPQDPPLGHEGSGRARQTHHGKRPDRQVPAAPLDDENDLFTSGQSTLPALASVE
jgi:hypothetical protein